MIFPLKNEGIHEGAEPMKPLMKRLYFSYHAEMK